VKTWVSKFASENLGFIKVCFFKWVYWYRYVAAARVAIADQIDAWLAQGPMTDS
jgi:hypothetical protein